jgi:hypothetical protein
MADKKTATQPEDSVEANQATAKPRFDFNNLNTLSVVSLATAVTGFGALAAIITGHIALSQVKASKQSGRPLALAGVIVGYSFIGLGILAMIAGAVVGRRYGFEPMGFGGELHDGSGHMGWFDHDDMGDHKGHGMGHGDDDGFAVPVDPNSVGPVSPTTPNN